MGMVNSKKLKRIIAELEKILQRAATLKELADAMQGRMPKK